MTCTKVKCNIYQLRLIDIITITINKLKEDVWVRYFKKVNLYPKHCVSY